VVYTYTAGEERYRGRQFAFIFPLFIYVFFPIVAFGSEKNKVCLPYKRSKSSRIKSLICVYVRMYVYGAKGEYIIYYYYNAP